MLKRPIPIPSLIINIILLRSKHLLLVIMRVVLLVELLLKALLIFTDDEVEPTFWFRKILPLLFLFSKVSLSFIIVFGTYLYIDEMMIIFYER